MKKFFNDNLWWMVIIAVVLGGYALYRTFNKKNEESKTYTLEAKDVTVQDAE